MNLKKSVDPDQLASLASWSGSTLFFQKRVYNFERAMHIAHLLGQKGKQV